MLTRTDRRLPPNNNPADLPTRPTSHVTLLHPPPHRLHGDRHHHGDPRVGGHVGSADLSVSEHHPTRNQHQHHLRRCRCHHGDGSSRDADRTSDQRCREHDLHVLDECEQRNDEPLCRFRAGNRPQHRPDSHPDALLPVRSATPHRCPQLRGHDPAGLFEPPGAVLALLAGRDLRRTLPLELRLHQRLLAHVSRERHRSGADLRCRRIRDASLGQPRNPREAPDHRARDRQCHRNPEHREPRWPTRRGTGAPRPTIHLHGSRPGAPQDRRRVREHRRARHPGRLLRPREGRGAC